MHSGSRSPPQLPRLEGCSRHGNERNPRRVTDVRVPKLMAPFFRAHSLVLMAAFVLAACSGSTSAPQHSPSPIAGALDDGLIAYVSSQGVGVIDPATGKPALFTEGAAPGVEGLVAVRDAATGAWYFLNPSLGVLNEFPLKPGQDDGPIVFSPDGTMAAISLIDHGALIEPVNLAPILPSPSAGAPSASPTTSPTARPTPTASPVQPRRLNSKLHHVDSLAWSPDAKTLAIAIDGGIQLYAVAGKDGDAPVKTYKPSPGITGMDWSGQLAGRSLAEVKAADNPQKFVDALLAATALPAAADTPANRALTRIYLWAYDSSKSSPIASITDATPAILQKYPPLAAQVNYDHLAPLESWALTGGCTRYRVVVTGSIAPAASTFGLQSNTACLGASPSPTPS